MVKYKSIAKDLISKIENNIYPVEASLPSEKELMIIYQSSRDTIRKAIDILVNNGYLLKKKGQQSIVIGLNKFDFSIENVHSFKEVSANLSNTFTSRLVKLQRVKVSHSDSNNFLKLENDAYYWHIQRIRMIDDLRVIFDEDFLVDRDNLKLTKEILENSLYEYLEEEQHLNIAYATKEVTVEMINQDDIDYLDINDYQMMAVVKSYTYLENGELLHYTISRHRPDRFKFNTFARRFK